MINVKKQKLNFRILSYSVSAICPCSYLCSSIKHALAEGNFLIILLI